MPTSPCDREDTAVEIARAPRILPPIALLDRTQLDGLGDLGSRAARSRIGHHEIEVGRLHDGGMRAVESRPGRGSSSR